ncbi:MAG: elongation factor G [Bacteroidales bacterium]|jgi:elongation factor G|nr:elongation factor G [Bacteroidales bacterium]
MSLEKLRNFGIAAHIDAGKTTTSERILFYTGVNRKIGEVHEGAATMDFMKQEQERGITIQSAAISAHWKGFDLNLIDTPGHVDFTMEVERSMRVVDGLVSVFCAVGGVQPQSETVWNQAEKYRVPRVAFINKMDRSGADFDSVVKQMDEILDARPVKLEIPIGAEDNFIGLIDVVTGKAYKFVDKEYEEMPRPAEYDAEYEAAHDHLLEKVAEVDEALMEKYFSDPSTITVEEIKAAIRKATINLIFTPVLCGSAYKNKGVQFMLDAVVDYLPSPLDLPAIQGHDPNDPEKEIDVYPDEKKPVAALAFKLINDPFVGQQVFTRVFQGVIKPGMTLENPNKGKSERIGRIYKIKAKDHVEINEAVAGDIVALIGLKDTKTGDTLCDEQHPVLLESITVPPPVIQLRVYPKNKKDQQKMGEALHKLSNEDPSFVAKFDEETNETVIAGMGELHLEIMVDRVKEEFKVEVEVGEPSVAYRETFLNEQDCEYKYAKQSGGKGQFAYIKMIMSPNPGKGYEFVNTVKGGHIPGEFIPSVDKGIQKTMEKGVLAGFPVVDVKINLYDGGFHPVDSSDFAFQTCASICFKDAFMKGHPVLLEPVMKLEVSTPDEYMGDIIGNLNKRRGRIEEQGPHPHRKGITEIKGYVPLAGMFGYANDLRNISSGRASFSMEFAQYEQLNAATQEEVLKKLAAKKAAEESR